MKELPRKEDAYALLPPRYLPHVTASARWTSKRPDGVINPTRPYLHENIHASFQLVLRVVECSAKPRHAQPSPDLPSLIKVVAASLGIRRWRWTIPLAPWARVLSLWLWTLALGGGCPLAQPGIMLPMAAPEKKPALLTYSENARLF